MAAGRNEFAQGKKIEEKTPKLEGESQNQRNETLWNRGHWSEKEKLKYALFLDYHGHKFKMPENRRLWKIFKIMGSFIKTRKSNQCRSYHQKREAEFSGISNILSFFKQQISDYELQLEKYSKSLEKLQFGAPLKYEENLEANVSQPLLKYRQPSSNLEKVKVEEKAEELLKTITSHSQVLVNAEVGSQSSMEKNLLKKEVNFQDCHLPTETQQHPIPQLIQFPPSACLVSPFYMPMIPFCANSSPMPGSNAHFHAANHNMTLFWIGDKTLKLENPI